MSDDTDGRLGKVSIDLTMYKTVQGTDIRPITKIKLKNPNLKDYITHRTSSNSNDFIYCISRECNRLKKFNLFDLNHW